MRPLPLLFLAAFGVGCGAAPERGDIVLVTIDTLRADHLGLYAYERSTSPRIDGWFESGRVFERAYATEAATAPSVASLLTGRLPQDHGVRLFYQLLEEDVALLPDLLPGEYETAAIVSNVVLTDEAIGFAGRFDHYDDFVDEREGLRDVFERRAARTTDAALRWVATRRDPERPLFLWVHYIDPHGPYDPPEAWTGAFPVEGHRPLALGRVAEYMVQPGVDNALEYVADYDAEIAYTDAEVGRLLDGLSQRLDLERALTVLTADHGETMMEGERWFSHGYQVYEPIVHVPLCLRGPGVAPGRVSELASGVDLVPTLLRFAGAAVPSGLPGRDLLAPDGDPDRVVYSEASAAGQQWRAAVQGQRKVRVLVRGATRTVLQQRQYDLAREAESGGGRPVGLSDPLVARLIEEIERDPDAAGIPSEYRAGMQIEAPKVAPDLDEKALQELRRLGYVE